MKPHYLIIVINKLKEQLTYSIITTDFIVFITRSHFKTNQFLKLNQ
jgi:hypothetical protein